MELDREDIRKRVKKTGPRKKRKAWKIDFPESWFSIKNTLQEENRDHIEFSRFSEICQHHHVDDPLEQKQLMGILNNLGIALHFENLIKYNTQILNPSWLTYAVYKIINSDEVKENQGLHNFGSVHPILHSGDPGFTYPEEKYPFILDVMREFELAYFYKDENQYLIPSVLCENMPDNGFDKQDASRVRFTFPFLPTSVISRFIVKSAEDIKDDLRWRFGVILENSTCHAQALVQVDTDRRHIDVWCRGDQKKDLLFFLFFLFPPFSPFPLSPESFLSVICHLSSAFLPLSPCFQQPVNKAGPIKRDIIKTTLFCEISW